MAFSGVTRIGGVLGRGVVVGELDEDGHGGVDQWTVVWAFSGVGSGLQGAEAGGVAGDRVREWTSR